MNIIRTVRTLSILSIFLLGLFTVSSAALAAEGEGSGKQVAQEGAGEQTSMLDARGTAFLAVAITMGMACLAAAFAVGKVGAAAMGAAAEKPEILTKAIVFAGLGEGIAIFGLIVSLFLLNKI
jgi:V/A-type H+-transporting ATPase subunit K